MKNRRKVELVAGALTASLMLMGMSASAVHITLEGGNISLPLTAEVKEDAAVNETLVEEFGLLGYEDEEHLVIGTEKGIRYITLEAFEELFPELEMPELPNAAEVPSITAASDPERISKLQEALIKLNYMKGKPDGIFGGETVNAISAFQEDHNMPATGTVGPRTAWYIADIAGQEPDLVINLAEPETETETEFVTETEAETESETELITETETDTEIELETETETETETEFVTESESETESETELVTESESETESETELVTESESETETETEIVTEPETETETETESETEPQEEATPEQKFSAIYNHTSVDITPYLDRKWKFTFDPFEQVGILDPGVILGTLQQGDTDMDRISVEVSLKIRVVIDYMTEEFVFIPVFDVNYKGSSRPNIDGAQFNVGNAAAYLTECVNESKLEGINVVETAYITIENDGMEYLKDESNTEGILRILCQDTSLDIPLDLSDIWCRDVLPESDDVLFGGEDSEVWNYE